MKSIDKADELCDSLNKIDIFKTNEEWVKSNTLVSPNNSLIYNDPEYFNEEFISLIEKFDNNINPFMNKDILLNDLTTMMQNFNIQINVNDNELNISIPSENISIKTKRVPDVRCCVNYDLSFTLSLKKDDSNYIEIEHGIYCCDNYFKIRDNEEKIFACSILNQNEELLKIIMDYLYAANNILEEKFISLLECKSESLSLTKK